MIDYKVFKFFFDFSLLNILEQCVLLELLIITRVCFKVNLLVFVHLFVQLLYTIMNDLKVTYFKQLVASH